MAQKSFDGVFEIPVPDRTKKPRNNGVTMIIDKGLGLAVTKDFLEMAGDYVDFLKFTFGTSAFIDRDLIEKKVELLKRHDVWTMPGGTLMEVAL